MIVSSAAPIGSPTPPPTGDELLQFHGKTLSPQRLLWVSSHLKDCSECRERLAAVDSSRTGIDHLTYEQKEQYVDGAMIPEESSLVEAHLRVCESCRQELAHLRKFTEMLADTPPNEPDR